MCNVCLWKKQRTKSFWSASVLASVIAAVSASSYLYYAKEDTSANADNNDEEEIKAGKWEENLPEYSLDEVAQHNLAIVFGFITNMVSMISENLSNLIQVVRNESNSQQEQVLNHSGRFTLSIIPSKYMRYLSLTIPVI